MFFHTKSPLSYRERAKVRYSCLHLKNDSLIPVGIGAEIVGIAGQHRIEHDARDRRNRKAREGDGGSGDMEGHAADGVEAEGRDKDNRGDDQVSGFGKVIE